MSYYQDDHHLQYKDERRFYHVEGVAVVCPDQLQHFPPTPEEGSPELQFWYAVSVLVWPSSRFSFHDGSAGTGVFLPPGCSTVLLPAGVIQALNLHFDRMERQGHSHPQQCSCSCGFPSWNDTMANNGNHYVNAKQKRQFRTATARWKQEIPQEWIY